ncbi:MAG: Ku protein [Cyanobacteria bacterium REEB65]|nr:Ku protein [Cyanobacteria bacterium REEB65]
MRVFWSGSISFGLVNIPIRLYPATSDHDIHFNQIHRADNGRVRYRIVCDLDDEPLDRTEIVKGYEYETDHYVTFTDEELGSLALRASRTLDILDFVDLDRVDPIYFRKGYYLAPQGSAAKAYELLRQALEQTQKVAIAQFVLHQKGRLALIRQKEKLLLLETMRYADEIHDPSQVPSEPAEISKRERDLAISLVESLSSEFEPERYRDPYRDRLAQAIGAKIAGKKIVAVAPPEEAKVVDLMQALERSLQRAR